MKNKLFFFLSLFNVFFILNNNAQSILLPTTYPLVLEKLIYFKKNQLKVFYGGPIDKKDQGAQWLMPVIFEDEKHNTRAVYEIAFINCNLETAEDAHLYFIDVDDINIKLKNNLSNQYELFSSLIKGTSSHEKYIVIRSCDIATVFFPDIFVSSVYNKQHELDKYEIIQFLHKKFKTGKNFTFIKTNKSNEVVAYENENEIVYKPIPAQVILENNPFLFWIEKRIRKHDLWKIYYIISMQPYAATQPENKSILLRIDSGCVSGQIYDDNACDCLDQLHNALLQIAHDKDNNGIIIHIPGHDGRGFGSAPKAETEIYKHGGCGRVHTTEPLNTIEAAHLLYGSDIFDLRTFDGIADLLYDMDISKVILLTDNVAKVTSLQNRNIEVVRQKTDSDKSTCINHIEAKKNSPLYFTE